jgi:hypothetical protein
MGGGKKSEILRKYSFLQKKYHLPEYHVINRELEIASLDSQKFLLRQIRRKIYHRLDDFCELIEDLLQPDATISQMHEYRFFSDKKRTKIFNI